MTFQKRSIKQKPRTTKNWKKAEHWVKGHLILSIIAIALGALTLKGVVGAMQVGKPFSVKQIVLSAISQDIKTDQYNHTNILLLGIGGKGHDGANLTDTMIVASIDHKNNLVPMLSIPRDFYVKNDFLGYGTRLNGIYELVLDETDDPEFAMETLMKEIENILDINLQYYAKVDFNGFTEIVDTVGGVDVNIKESIYDPYYPAPDSSAADYDPLFLKAGEQTLDGKTTLKYVRSRKTTSDFDRARRQQEVIAALKNKATRIGFLLNPAKLKGLYTAISNNFETNLSWTEMLYLAQLADKFGSDSVMSEVLNDEAYKTGGFLYTPEREFYGGAFVLVPFSGDNAEIQAFTRLFFYHSNLFQNPTPIQVLNGTSEPGLAAMSKMYLERYGFNVVRYGNGLNKGVEKTRIFTTQKLDKADEQVLQLIPSLLYGEIQAETPPEYNSTEFDTEAKIIIELGEDFLDFYNNYDERFYVGF